MVNQNLIKSRETKSGRGEVAPTKMEMPPTPHFLNDHVYILDCVLLDEDLSCLLDFLGIIRYVGLVVLRN